MAARLQQWIARIGWTRVAVAVVLLGLTSLVVSALVSNSQPAPQQVAGSSSSDQEQQAAVPGVIINPAAETASTTISMAVQTGSYASRGSASASKPSKPTGQAKHSTSSVQAQKLPSKQTKHSAAKGLKQNTTKGKGAKASTNKATSPTAKVKQSSHSTLPSDTLFPELRGK
jgi:hypothetical protein